MSYRLDEQTGDIVIEGFEKGIGASPHKGIANIQNGNISTENGEVMISYARTQQTLASSSTSGTFTASDATHLQSSLTKLAGNWISVTSSTITNLTSGPTTYYVLNQDGNSVQVSTTYRGSVVGSLGLTGTANFALIRNMGQPISSATETYSTGTALAYRYYVLDSNGLVWVLDSNETSTGVKWFLPDISITYYGSNIPNSVSVLNGWLLVFAGNEIFCKPTVILTTSNPGYVSFASGILLSPATSPNPHYSITTQAGILYYTDGRFVGSIFPNTSLLNSSTVTIPNIQSYASYTASTITGTISVLIGGSLPTIGTNVTTSMPVPAVFFSTDAIATALNTAGNSRLSPIFYIIYSLSAGTFKVYATQADALANTSAIDIETGSSGTQYFNTFCPTNTTGKTTITFTPQNFVLPFKEISTCLAELGNTIIVGTKGNVLYPWNQIDSSASDLIPLPENNTVNMLTVNNMVYVFSGAKGNIYITNGSTASVSISVPDYCSGIAGTPSSYIEPYFTWGGIMFLRGRVYFSILDQTSAKSGNCGGIWSFIPTQNMSIYENDGTALRMENQNSYGTYSGVATVLLASMSQNAISPQYWSGWYSSITSATYGIDFTDTSPSTNTVIESDLIPTGTLLKKKTYNALEYKLSAPLVSSSESVALSYRLNSTDSYTSAGTVVQESSTNLSGYFSVTFEKTQWIQVKATLSSSQSGSTSSFVRLKELRIR